MLEDPRGTALSGASVAAADLFERALLATCAFRGDPMGLARQALDIDPTLTSARLLEAHLFAFSLNAPFTDAARRALEGVHGLCEPNERERGHMAAIEAWLDREPERASDLLGKVVESWPRDLMAIFFCHQADFFAAREAALVERPRKALEAWGEDLPGRGYVVGMCAFGLEERGDLDKAEALAREALTVAADDVWSIHAVAHVMETQGRDEEGEAWYAAQERYWAKDCYFAVHNWWHRALFRFDAEDHASTLGIYDQGIAPDRKSISLNLCDAAGLLWRLHLAGIDCGERWSVLAEHFSDHIERPFHVFNDVHAGLAFLGAGRDDLFDELLGRLRIVANDETGHGRMVTAMGLPFIQAARALVHGRPEEAARGISAIMSDAHLMTGSRAQRDLVPVTMIEASLRAGDRSSARSLLERRLAAKPESPRIARDLARC